MPGDSSHPGCRQAIGIGAEAEIEITGLGLAGDAIGTLEGHSVFVPHAAPGDRLRVRLERAVEGGWRGRILALLCEGPGRVAAPCPHFADCGGCSLQHLAEPAHRRWKQALVAQALARRGLAAPVARLICIPAGFRRRASLAAEAGSTGIRLGFNAAASARVVDLSTCLLLTPRLRALLGPLRAALRPVLRPGERADALVTDTDSGIDLWLQIGQGPSDAGRRSLIALAEAQDLARVSVGPGAEPLLLRRPPRVRFGTVGVDLPPGAFLQPSAPGEAVLVRAVTAAMRGRRRVADLFAGCGTFTFALAAAATLHAVEGDAAAHEALVAAARHIPGRVTAERRDLARLPLDPGELSAFDAVLLDPPRAGAKAQAKAIAGSRLDLAVYVSCEPRSFARDARLLIDGGWRLERVLPVDQFPWAAHVELVGVFRR